MKISISSDALFNRLSILSKALGAGNKNSSSILNCFLFKVENGNLSITASDSENTMTASLSLIENDMDGVFAINSQHILDAVRGLADQPITLTIDDASKAVKMQYANGSCDFIADDASAYPQPQGLSNNATTIKIPANILLANLDRTIFATADDQLRLVMNGIYFDLQSDFTAIVASDGHKLVRNMITSIKSEQTTAFILSKKPAQLLKGCVTSNEAEVSISFDDRNAIISFDGGELSCRLIEGRYPNYNSVIPKDNPYEIEVNRKMLLGALKRVLPFASESSQLVRLDITPNNISVKSEDLEFATKAVENVTCSYEGAPISIGFKGSGFQAVLSNLPFDEVRLSMGDPSRPCLVLPVEQPADQNVLMLIMPMLLND